MGVREVARLGTSSQILRVQPPPTLVPAPERFPRKRAVTVVVGHYCASRVHGRPTLCGAAHVAWHEFRERGRRSLSRAYSR